jgi:hypothetical protein
MLKVGFVCASLILSVPSVAADEVGTASSSPREMGAAAEGALFDLACAKLVDVFAAKSEEVHRAEMPGWIRICSAHPKRSECVDTAYLIRGYNKASPLDCGSGIRRNSDIASSFLPAFDQACAEVTAAWLSNTENQHQMEVAGWLKTCNAHPDVSVCKGADGLIYENRKVRPLNCGSSGS